VTAFSVIALLATQASGATGTAAGPLAPHIQARELTAAPRVASEKCPSARKAVRFYQRRYAEWRAKMGAGLQGISFPADACPHSYLVHLWVRKAHAAHKAFIRWYRNEWNWRAWLPAKFYRVARCETGVRWDWDSGTYVSAFGIIRVAYEWYHPWTGRNSPREQYEVASAIQARFGWSAWGCGGA
jgi:hypothetical protein